MSSILLFLLSLHSVNGSRAIGQSLPSLGGLLLSPPSFSPALFDVRLDVEVGEETDEGEGVANQSVVHPLWEVAVNVERMDGVDYCKTELKL